MNNLTTWTNPDSYMGFNPVDDYVICGQSRDSDALERSNYQRIFEDLIAKAESLNCQNDGIDGEGDQSNMVYDFRANHWAVGWVETVLICGNAPQELTDYAESIGDALADYPVYDEDHYSELEWTESQEYWEGLQVSERVEIIQDCASNCNIFAARHNYSPDDCGVDDYLRTP